MPLLPGPIQIISGGTIPTRFHPFDTAAWHNATQVRVVKQI